MLFKKLMQTSTYFLSACLPATCILCMNPTQQRHNICQPCLNSLPSLTHTCPVCAQILHSAATLTLICGACQKNPPPFNQTYALFPYVPPIIKWVVKLKFQHQLAYAKTFADLFSDKAKTTWYQQKPLPDILIPIPLHAKRLRERGFNQAVEIARPIATALGMRLDISSATRHKATARQSTLVANKRKQNIAGAFTVTNDYSGLTVAIFDDVITTGNTVREFCKTLKLHGAERIDVWCCARRT